MIFNDIIYAPTRVKPLLALRAGGRGDITSSHLLWSTPNGPDVPTPVTDGKYFYVVNDRGIMWCLDAKTGAEIYGPAANQAGHLQRLAGAGRRQDLRDERRRTDDRGQGGTDV